MSLAERTRAAVRETPFLHEAVRAGLVNYRAAARYLDVGPEEAVAAALRRYAADLPGPGATGGARVTMQSGVGVAGRGEPVLAVGDREFTADGGELTGVLATGDVPLRGAWQVLGRCETADIDPVAVGVTGETLVLVVERRDGPAAVRLVEDCLEK